MHCDGIRFDFLLDDLEVISICLTLSNTPFELSDLVLKFFKISLACVIGNFGLHIQIQHPNFSLIANFHDLSANEFNFMRITNLKIYKGFDRE